MLAIAWGELVIGVLGAVHAAAAFFYFSKARHAAVWATSLLAPVGRADSTVSPSLPDTATCGRIPAESHLRDEQGSAGIMYNFAKYPKSIRAVEKNCCATPLMFQRRRNRQGVSANAAPNLGRMWYSGLPP